MGHQTEHDGGAGGEPLPRTNDTADPGGLAGGTAAGIDDMLPLAPPDVVTRADAQRRLRRIEGQVRGLQQMLENDRYCGEILDQIAAVQQALRATGREIIRGHVDRRMPGLTDDAVRRTLVRDELIGLMSKKF